MDLEDLIEDNRRSFERWEKIEAETQALNRHLAEMPHLQAQTPIKLRAFYDFNTMSLPCLETTISANATATISNDTTLESVTPPVRDMGVDPISLDTTSMGIADTIHVYHAGDNGLLEGNPCTSDTKDELTA